jgi:hypothetical protein
MSAPSTMYAGRSTSSGTAVPVTANGGVDINALMAQMVSRDIWTYYYTLKVAAATTFPASYTLFNAVSGSVDPYAITSGQNLSHVETNMPSTSSQGFPPPRDLILDNLGFYFRAGGCGLASQGVGTFAQPSDMLAFTQYSYFEFKIIDKVFIEGYLELQPAGYGFTGMSTQSQTGIWTLGIANPHAVNRMNKFAKYLAPQMQWSLVIYFPSGSGPAGVSAATLATTAGGVGLWLVANLKGLTDRAVQ